MRTEQEIREEIAKLEELAAGDTECFEAEYADALRWVLGEGDSEAPSLGVSVSPE